jgi:hypothetical protein
MLFYCVGPLFPDSSLRSLGVLELVYAATCYVQGCETFLGKFEHSFPNFELIAGDAHGTFTFYRQIWAGLILHGSQQISAVIFDVIFIS